ncbi:MAG: DF family (seleno)protein [Anaerolineales bacterium]
MKIELLYFDGCPSWENGLKNLETALQEEGLIASVEMVKVMDDEVATQLKFLGSPSFRIDGHDLWHEERENYSLSCRVYPTPEGIKGFPTVTMLREQLKQFKGA